MENAKGDIGLERVIITDVQGRNFIITKRKRAWESEILEIWRKKGNTNPIKNKQCEGLCAI